MLLLATITYTTTMGFQESYAGRASAWLYRSSPLMMLIAYCVASFMLYKLLPPLVHEIIWYIFAVLQTLTSINVFTEAIHSLRPSFQARRDMRQEKKQAWTPPEGQSWPHIDVVLVAYLPNEEEIIMKQARYALSRIDYPSSYMTLNIVYNTPEPMPDIEDELADLEKQHDNVRVIKAIGSQSKAENINYFLSLAEPEGEIITIYDTDHYAEPSALRWVARRFLSGEVDIIQGRCCTYNYSDSLITRMVASEFDMIYGVMHLGRATLHAYGFFGGSNGHWNASLLRSIRMDPNMLTEDIDSSMRAIISGARIEYNVRVLSYELAPTTLRSLVSQRLRWAQGWSQVTLKHFMPALRRGAYSDNNGVRSKLGLLQLLAYREFYYYINSQLFWILISSLCTTLPKEGFHTFFKNFGGFAIAMWTLFLNLACLTVVMAITQRNRSHFTDRWGILFFSLSLVFYYIIVSHMAIMCHFRELSGHSTWKATERGRVARRVSVSEK
jgi:cellulose synthase/poly-beta-1,6-N-acetylglucosamine synthase-like glycosyltransferase